VNIEILAALIKVVLFPIMLMQSVPLLVWVERRGSAFIQDRLGPNRAPGPFGFKAAGLFHLIADAVKFFTKESFIPAQAHKFYYVLAPALVVIQSLMAFAVIPVADHILIEGYDIPMSITEIPGGIVYVFAIASLGVLGIILAGWSSGSKYPLLGAVRTASQMLSYEVSLGLSVLGVLLVYGTLDLNQMVREQGHLIAGVVPGWGLVYQPLGFIMFWIIGFAECNRSPFDLPEGESELVAGYHTEYSAMKFSMFFMAEYIAMITYSSMIVTLFVGGWQIPWMPTEALRPVMSGIFGVSLGALATALCQIVAFVVKVAFFLWVFVWVRWTVPRFRYDQLMNLGWKILLPLTLVNLAVTAVILALKGATGQ
jgi:NADH-quinone oxidoreductase subunit H